MTMDKSLRVRAGSTRSRNVLTRAERIEQLKGSDRFADETNSPYGLPKTRVAKLSMKKKKKKAAEGEEDAAKPAAGAKGAAAKPAAGAKPAAAAAAKPAAKPAAKK
ncbi:MAG: small basic protein [Pirellula sp.]|nr:small basic protein [Pirellula sp.]